MTPAEIIKDILVTAGVGVFADSSDFSLWVSAEPDKPDSAITVYDTGGDAPSPAWLVNFPSVQVMIRGTENGYQTMFAKAEEVVNALLGYPSADFTGQRLVSVRQVGGITFLGYDEKRRPRLSTNWTLITEPDTGTYRESL
jgi:hypothetical protein